MIPYGGIFAGLRIVWGSGKSVMTFPVMVQSIAGRFEATLLGAPEVRATGETRAMAIAAIESLIEQRVQRGELVTVEIGRKGLMGLFGKYGDDPTLQDICDEAYRERDADVRE